MTTDTNPAFDFEEYLKTDEFASWHNVFKHRTIIFRVTGSLSTIASACMIIHILRSHHGLSTTYHRLVFGLSLGDFFFSFLASVLDSTMAPKEMNYIIPFAMGNRATCDAQGFLVTFASGLTLAYNMSICFYYLAIVTFDKKDECIQKKLEPWFHGLSIIPPLFLTSMGLVIDGYNSSEGTCWFTPNNQLPHCRGVESGEIRNGFTIPCGRGDGKENPALYRALVIFQHVYILLAPVVVVITMTLMYRSVHKVEKKMQQYGVSALRLRSSSLATSRTSDRSSTRSSRRLRSSTVTSQKRAILRRATGYVAAWALSWIPLLIWSLSDILPVTMFYIYAFLFPLQGVFNFIVFMHPKIRSAKKGPRRRRGSRASNEDVDEVSWGRAFVKAYLSRGERKRTRLRHLQCDTRNNRVSFMDSLPNVVSKLKNSSTNYSGMPLKSSILRNGNRDFVSKQATRPIPNPGDRVDTISDEKIPCADENGDSTSNSPLVLAEDDDLKEVIEDSEVEEFLPNGTNENKQ